MSVLVVDGALAEGLRSSPCLVPVARPSRTWRGGSAMADAIVDVLEGARPRGVVLARAPRADTDTDAAILPQLARVMALEVVRLPDDVGLCRWLVALAAVMCQADCPDLTRRLQTLAGVEAAGLPRRPWGWDGASVPALRPRVLARWAWHAWKPCAACPGGGHEAAPCARCGRRR